MLGELKQAINLRDIGGASTADGAAMRRGWVYRSAAPAHLTEAQRGAVAALLIRTIIDLRRNAERMAYPTPWQALGCSDYWARDHERSDADLIAQLRRTPRRPADARHAMIALYGELPYSQHEAHARLFRAIVDARGPVLFHCAAGKDRTGVAAALILATVGVPREVIMQDYVATDREDLDNLPHRRALHAMPNERRAALAPIFSADPAYLDAMFAALERRSGSIDSYLLNTLQLTAAELEQLRQVLRAAPGNNGLEAVPRDGRAR
jgi:protein-tyrosine phosphatase